MTGAARLYIPASAFALAGMAWRIGWLAWLPRIGATVLIVFSGLMVVLALIVPFVALGTLITWLLRRLMTSLAFVAALDPSGPTPEKQP